MYKVKLGRTEFNQVCTTSGWVIKVCSTLSSWNAQRAWRNTSSRIGIRFPNLRSHSSASVYVMCKRKRLALLDASEPALAQFLRQISPDANKSSSVIDFVKMFVCAKWNDYFCKRRERCILDPNPHKSCFVFPLTLENKIVNKEDQTAWGVKRDYSLGW